MNAKKKYLILGAVALLLVCCVSSGLFLLYINAATEKMDAAKAACRRQPVPGTPRRVPHTMQPVAAFGAASNGDWMYFGAELPVAWPHAEAATDPAVVFCFEEEESETLETCRYETGSTYTRVLLKRRVRAVEASTGIVIREKFVSGTPPEPCPDSITHRRSSGPARDEGEGDSPDADDIEREFGELFR